MTIRTYTSDDIGASGRGREGAICREGRGFQVYSEKGLQATTYTSTFFLFHLLVQYLVLYLFTVTHVEST